MMFAKLTALFAVATVAVSSPVPQDPLDPILSIVESIIDGALPTAVVPIGGLPAVPTDAAGIASVLNELSSVLAELPVPTGLAGILPLDTEKRDVNVPAVPTGTVTALAGPAPTAELLKPTEDLDIGGIISGLPIVGPILGPILGGLLGSLPIVGGLGLTLPSSTPVPL